MSYRSLVLVLVVASSPLAGCACGDVTLGEDDGGPADVGRRGPHTDECGNGLDDDGNGSIDDGCPCAPGETQRCFSGALASNEVGACMGGTQTCAVIAGSEWGDWGVSACEGEVLPASETCDGGDADCDGATDEGCPCTDGMMRPCGEEFVIAPCMAGAQACRGGAWSTCEGAVGPTADVCGDELDNDCDGLSDEMCECPFPPVPERCRDRVDNDCDGDIDEPECTPDWPRDAGVPMDARVEPDAPLPCVACSVGGGSVAMGAHEGPNMPGTGVTLTSDGHDVYGGWTESIPSGPPDARARGMVAAVALDGALTWETPLGRNVAEVAWTGTHVAATYGDASGGHLAIVRPDGTVATTFDLTATATLASGSVVVVGDELALAWSEAAADLSSEGFFQRRNLDGSPRGPTVSLGQLEPVSMVRTASGWLVGGRYAPPGQVGRNAAVVSIEGNVLVGTYPLEAYSAPCSDWPSSGAVLASGCGGVMACWRNMGPCPLQQTLYELCQPIDVDGRPLGTAQPTFTRPRIGESALPEYLDLMPLGDGFLLRGEYAISSLVGGRRETYVLLDAMGRPTWVDEISVPRPNHYEYGDLVMRDGALFSFMYGVDLDDAILDDVHRWRPDVRTRPLTCR